MIMEQKRIFRIGKYEDIMKDWANHSDNIGTLGENEGRTGYFHVCKEGEELHEEVNELEVFEYEGAFDPIPLPC